MQPDQAKHFCLERAAAKEWIKWRNLPDTDCDHTAESTGKTMTYLKESPKLLRYTLTIFSSKTG